MYVQEKKISEDKLNELEIKLTEIKLTEHKEIMEETANNRLPSIDENAELEEQVILFS